MKNIITIILLTVALTLALTAACTQKKAQTPNVGIALTVSHPALEAIKQGIVDEIDASGIQVTYDIQNANGDMNTAASIANKFKAEKNAVSIGIATPVAVAIANAIKDKPVIFATVNDPVGAGLVDDVNKGTKNVTGLSDMLPIKTHIETFRQIVPFKKLGFIYTNSESNSAGMAAKTKMICEELGIEFIPTTITSSSEVKQAAESLIGRVDAFYVVTDNTLVSGLNSLLDTAAKNKIPVFSADKTSAMNGGVLFTIGFDYYKAGKMVGALAVDVLKGKNTLEMPTAFMQYPQDADILVDLDNAAMLGISLPSGKIPENASVIQHGKIITKSEVK